MGGEIHQQQEENLYRGNDGGSIGRKPGFSFVPQPQDESVSRQQQRPEQQQALLSRLQSGEFVWRRQTAIAVMKNVGDREIILEGGDDQDESGEKDNRESGDFVAAPGVVRSVR